MTDFLDHLYAHCDGGWVSLLTIDRTTGEKNVAWIQLGDWNAIDPPTGACVWFGAATRTERLPGGRRGGTGDCAQIPALWVDIDIQSPVHAATDLPADIDQARQLLDAYPLAPTVTVDSGNGLQAWWLLDEPLDAADAAAILADWGTTWNALGHRHGWHVDNVFDVARVMRLPETHNHKTDPPRPVAIIDADWERTYGLDQIDEHTLDAPPAPATQPTRNGVPYIGPERPGDAYNATHTGAELLEAHGFHFDHEHNGDRHYRAPHRPAKNEGTGATAYHDGHTTIWSQTFARQHGIVAARPYDPFGLYVQLEHNGDFAAATRALRLQGYGSDDWTDVNPPAQQPGQLPDPIPLDTGHRHGPPFPLDALPGWITQMCTEVEWSYQVPADLPAMLALGCLSTLTAGKVRINVNDTNWTEHTNLYLVTAMPPGSGKSPVFKKMTKAVKEIEKRARANAKARNHDIEARRSVLDKRRTEMQKAAEPGEATIRALAELIGEIEDLPRPSDGAMVVEDITPEALVESLADNGGRLALLSSEGGVFDMMAGQYMDRGKATNLAVYLQGWSADEVRRKRKGSADFVIDEAILTICVTTQPGVVATLGANKELVRKGVPTRFMYSCPPSLVGYRDRSRVRTTVSADVADRYDQLMVQIGDRCLTTEYPTVLELDAEASQVFIDWDQHLEDRQKPKGDLAERAEWAAKLRASVLRVAALLHIAHNAEQGPRATYGQVGIDALNDAITIGHYWLDHAEVVERLWTDDADVNRAATLLELLVDAGVYDFTLRDAYDLKRGTFPTANDAIGPLQILVDRNWVQPHQAEPVAMSGRGKAGQRFSLRPDASSFLRATAQPAQLDENGGEVARVARVARNERDSHPPTHTPSPSPEIDETPAQPAQPAQLAPTGTDNAPIFEVDDLY